LNGREAAALDRYITGNWGEDQFEEEMMNKIVEQEAPKGAVLMGVTEDMCVQVEKYRGKVRVDVRKWYQNGSSEFARGRNGLNVEISEWDQLMAKIVEINEFVQAQRTVVK